MATIGNITVRWNDLTTGNPVSRTDNYPNQDMATQRPIDIINKHSGQNKPIHGKIWKMRKVNSQAIPHFDDRLSHYVPFSDPINGITGSTDVILDQV